MLPYTYDKTLKMEKGEVKCYNLIHDYCEMNERFKQIVVYILFMVNCDITDHFFSWNLTLDWI